MLGEEERKGREGREGRKLGNTWGREGTRGCGAPGRSKPYNAEGDFDMGGASCLPACQMRRTADLKRTRYWDVMEESSELQGHEVGNTGRCRTKPRHISPIGIVLVSTKFHIIAASFVVLNELRVSTSCYPDNHSSCLMAFQTDSCIFNFDQEYSNY